MNELILMTSLHTDGMSNVVESMRKHGEAVFKDSDSAVRAGGVKVDSILIEAMGDQAGTFIVEQTIEWRANLIVMGTHGRRGVRAC